MIYVAVFLIWKEKIWSLMIHILFKMNTLHTRDFLRNENPKHSMIITSSEVIADLSFISSCSIKMTSHLHIKLDSLLIRSSHHVWKPSSSRTTLSTFLSLPMILVLKILNTQIKILQRLLKCTILTTRSPNQSNLFLRTVDLYNQFLKERIMTIHVRLLLFQWVSSVFSILSAEIWTLFLIQRSEFSLRLV